MGRRSSFLYIGDRGSLIKKLNRELCSNNKNDNTKNNLQAKANSEKISSTCNNNKNEKIEQKVAYGPSNLPREVIFMCGLLEIRPSILEEYITDVYKSR